jgi:AcrR family transcriptional regulator
MEKVMKPSDPYRKLPQQARSQATVDAILEATSRILQTNSKQRLTTNAIAESAGISIGTLYQYFPDKNAILITLARQELAVTDKAVSAGLTTTEGKDVKADPVRAGIRALINGFKGRQRTRKVLIEVLIANGLADELASPVDSIMRELLATQAQGDTAMKPVTAYVLTRAVIGTLRAAVMEQSAYLSKPEFEDELVKLVRALMVA